MSESLCTCRYAVEAMTSAYALYDFGLKHNKTAATWNADVQETYAVGASGQFMLYAATMITWAHRCENTNLPLCSDNKARKWLAVSEQQWEYQVVRILLPFCCAVFSATRCLEFLPHWSPEFGALLSAGPGC